MLANLYKSKNIKKIKQQAVKEWLVMDYPLGKDIFSWNKYINLSEWEKEWGLISFDYDGKKTIDEAAHNMDRILNDAMRRIKNKYPEKTVFGLGLSGGYDSRLVLHYALKNGMNVKTFIFGEPYPHKLVLSRDNKNAILISKLYGIDPPKFIRYQNVPVLHKILTDSLNNPLFSYGFEYHIPNYAFPDFDILLTGSLGGDMLGSTTVEGMQKYSTDEMVHLFFKKLTRLQGTQIGRIKTEIPGVFSKEDYSLLYNKLYDFISKFDDNVEAMQSYRLMTWHRSLGYNPTDKGYIAAETPFADPEFFEEYKTWNPEWIIGRKLQKHFFNRIHPDLAKIPNQRWNVPFYYQDRRPQMMYKMWYAGMFALRWYGMQYFKIVASKEFRQFARNIFDMSNPIFDGIFNKEKLLSLPKSLSVILANAIRIKIVLDILYYKEETEQSYELRNEKSGYFGLAESKNE